MEDHQDCHLKRGEHNGERTRSGVFHGAEEDQHIVRPRDKVE